MIFADKLIKLRKKTGITQEELAIKMNVKKKLIKKWESAKAVPGSDDVIKLSNLFHVSTDFLLKSESNVEEMEADQVSLNLFCMDKVNDYLKHTKKNAIEIAIGTVLCILSPITLIVLSLLSGNEIGFIKTDLAVIIGMSILFAFVLTGVILFIITSFSEEKYSNLITKDLIIDENVSENVKDKENQFRDTYNKCILAGVILCILSPIPLFIAAYVNNIFVIASALLMLFVMVSIAVFLFVLVSIRFTGFGKLLQTKKYLNEHSKHSNSISAIIWILATCIYLTVSLIFGYWNLTWIVWVIAALTQVIVSILYKEND